MSIDTPSITNDETAMAERLDVVSRVDLPRFVCIDDESSATSDSYAAHLASKANRSERRKAKRTGSTDEDYLVEVDIGYEFTLYGHQALSEVELQACLVFFDFEMPFPGSISYKKASSGWLIKRSDGNDLPFTGSLGWMPSEYGRTYCCMLSNGSTGILANAVRDPNYNPAAVRATTTHRD